MTASQNLFAKGPIPVVRVLTWLPVGGVERRVIGILRRLNREKFAPRIVLIRERGALAADAEAAGIPVDLVPMKSRWSPPGLVALRRRFEEIRPGIVHSHMYRSNVPATVAARFARVPVVLAQVHNVDTWEGASQLWMDRALCRWRTGMLAVSGAVKDDVVKRLGVPENFVHLLYNGIDIEAFAAESGRFTREERRTAREQEGLPPDAVVAIVVARLHPQKNHARLFEAFAQARRQAPDLHLWCVGDGKLREELGRRAGELGIAPHVTFAGSRNDVARLLALADFAVLVSEKEGFSNALLEAMAAGLPQVVTDVGGNAEALRDGHEGFVIASAQDVDGIARAIARLGKGDAARRMMGLAASERVKAFSLDQMARTTEQLYERLLGRRS